MKATQGTTILTAASPITAYRLTHGYEPAYTKLYWSVANVVGINQALLIQIIESWCMSNARLNKNSYFHQGEWWTSATYKEWENAYPALGSQRSIQRLLLGLEESGYVISCQLKKNKGNAAKFYRVDPVKVGALLLKDLSVIQKISDVNNTNTETVSMMPKMDDVNNTNTETVSMMPKMDDVNNTQRPIVPKMDGIVPKMDGIVPKMDGVKPESPLQQSFQLSNKIKEIILTQSITGGTEKKTEEESKANGQNQAVPDHHYTVNKDKVSTTNDQSTHEDHFSGAARENDSQSLVFSSDPVKEVDFLLYYQTYQRSLGKDINSVASYVTTVLSKQDEGTTEVLCMFEQWKAACRTLQQKINNYADDPTEKEKQRKKYDFQNWQQYQHIGQYETLKSIGRVKFCSTSLVSAKWYEWASAKFPERFVDIPD